MKDLLKHLQGQDSGQWANNKVSSLDRTLGELSRILEKQVRRNDHDIYDTIYSTTCIINFMHNQFYAFILITLSLLKAVSN